MALARVFQSGNSQAVRLPKEFRFDVTELEIFRRGDELVLRRPQPRNATQVFEALCGLPADGLTQRDDPPAQERESL